ncbi:aminoglycoside/choline kinase family phosphotransferase [Bacillus mesophilus]|uniref:Aminoglycoside phosphotransferase family protein n=1 Tax=Bacillus mesophilus TaxID=1808955 RepID=A0A6M0Q7M6_9BACI|nr:aminoglycoside phosphotransferase family protein [Bacillus mesophilus]MBM7660987.1 aminoglycoside/choline kinase family phosphotransferase [Bacillus mesophilus]NEY71470.1 aminoglycoside phosphotransferase family protein [Bacillus mesophilus]
MLNRMIKQFRLQVQSINEVEDSHSSTVYKCTLLRGENVYLKIPYTQLKCQRELEAYEILKGSVSIPEMLDYWPGDKECPGAFLLSELKGKPLSAKDSSIVAFQVGVLHASMHTVQPPAKQVLTGIQNEYPTWATFIENQFYSFARDVKDVIDERLFNKALERFEGMKQQLPSPDGPSFVHMDFRPGNIIVDGTQVSGVIDFESVRFGSTEGDFTKLYRDFLQHDEALYKAFQEGYKSIRPLVDLEVVLPFYQYTDAFNSIGWCKRRGIERNALFLEENLVRLKTWLK